jgi:hypothetical protein
MYPMQPRLEKRGILYSPLIASAGAAIAQARGKIAALVYPGTVDFSPARVLKTDAMGNPTEASTPPLGRRLPHRPVRKPW